MKPVCATSQFAIFDDVLSEEEFERFWRMFRNADFRTIHAERVRAYFRASDGHPYTGGNVAWTSTPIDPLLPPGMSIESLPVRFYPTRDAYDAVIDALRRRVQSCADIIGREGHDWVGILGRLYAYPSGCSISWHSDDTDCTGAFIFYGNPVWDVQWGGELCVADESTRDQLTREVMHDFDNRHETGVLMRRGVGRYVMPKPNRLVFVGAGNPHMVAKISPAAGDNVRASFAGFFMKPKGVEQLLNPQRRQ
ncbi:2OG-Fe(II) oxygenase [Sorangium sp. So ce118]